MRSSVLRLALSVATAALASHSANADTLFTDLGSGGTYTANTGANGYNVYGAANTYDHTAYLAAAPFTVGGTGIDALTQIDLAVAFGNESTTPHTFSASIYTDVAGALGALVPGATWSATTTLHVGDPGDTTYLVSIAGISGVDLTGGATYFMVLSPPVLTGGLADVWGQSATTNSPMLYSNNGTTWASYGSSVPEAAFDVLGSPVTTSTAATPEPSSFALLASGLAGVASLARRRLTATA